VSFEKWLDELNHEDFEAHLQWELLVSAILAGAMTEIGSKLTYSNFYGSRVTNSDWVTSVFEPK
jgi:hypothetical protein